MEIIDWFIDDGFNIVFRSKNQIYYTWCPNNDRADEDRHFTIKGKQTLNLINGVKNVFYNEKT